MRLLNHLARHLWIQDWKQRSVQEVVCLPGFLESKRDEDFGGKNLCLSLSRNLVEREATVAEVWQLGSLSYGHMVVQQHMIRHCLSKEMMKFERGKEYSTFVPIKIVVDNILMADEVILVVVEIVVVVAVVAVVEVVVGVVEEVEVAAVVVAAAAVVVGT